MDRKWTNNGPKLDRIWTTSGPRLDRGWTDIGPNKKQKQKKNNKLLIFIASIMRLVYRHAIEIVVKILVIVLSCEKLKVENYS